MQAIGTAQAAGRARFTEDERTADGAEEEEVGMLRPVHKYQGQAAAEDQRVKQEHRHGDILREDGEEELQTRVEDLRDQAQGTRASDTRKPSHTRGHPCARLPRPACPT
jgi:hypothetical protein